MTKTFIILLACVALVVVAGIFIKVKRISPLKWGWYGAIQTTDGLAMCGYDAIAYFSDSALVGDATHAVEWQGVTWRFASEEHKAAFQADPARYAPQFGGFCSYAASKGFTAKIDPTAFKVHEGKLYLFNDSSMRANWIAELPDGVIEKARENWKARTGPF